VEQAALTRSELHLTEHQGQDRYLADHPTGGAIGDHNLIVRAAMREASRREALHYVVMPIPEILKQIDAEIARLKQARHILAGKPPAPKPKAKRTRAAAARQPIREVQRRRRASEKTPVVTVLEPVVRRKRAAQPRAVVPATTALTATVPMGPIAVRAADVPVRVALPPPPPRRGILDAANFLN
jgi:hypothetical protein